MSPVCNYLIKIKMFNIGFSMFDVFIFNMCIFIFCIIRSAQASEILFYNGFNLFITEEHRIEAVHV